MSRLRIIIALIAAMIAITGAVIMARPAIVDKNNLWPYVTGIIVGPTPEAALRNNPGVKNAIALSNATLIGLILVILATAIQTISIVTEPKRSDHQTTEPALPKASPGALIRAAFEQAQTRYPALFQDWQKIALRIGALLPTSQFAFAVQRDTQIDLVLRSMEDDRAAGLVGDHFSFAMEFQYQKYLSDLWVCSVYEMLRLMRERLVENNRELDLLAHDFTILRMPLEKHEIAEHRKLGGPVELFRERSKSDSSDTQMYSKGDKKRAYIVPTQISPRGSVVWITADAEAKQSRPLERRELSDRLHRLLRGLS